MLSTKLKEAAGNGVDATLYVDDVFSTYLFQTSPTSQTITTNIDMTKGALTWIKNRTNNSFDHILQTSAGTTGVLSSNQTVGAYTGSYRIAESTTGFTMGTDYYVTTPNPAVVWTFRKAAKFFDVVTYTGNGGVQNIAHSLGVAPGMIFVKCTNAASNWQVYSNGLASPTYSIQLNLTNAQASASSVWNSTAPTSSVFTVGADSTTNGSGRTYVAYLFAHDTSSTGIIQCGEFTDTAGSLVNLGWEPQFVLVKLKGATGPWMIYDSMRGMTVNATLNTQQLTANTADAEVNATGYIEPTSTGFKAHGLSASESMIYMAIRRPNKPPTSGTQVFSPVSITSSGTTTDTAGFPVDLVLEALTGTATAKSAVDRLRGGVQFLYTNLTNAESNQNPYGALFDNNTSVIWKSTTSGYPMVFWNFKRAPGFFDVVCYTGTGATQTINHNLGAVPELMIWKRRSATTGYWVVGSNFGASNFWLLYLNDPYGGVQPNYTYSGSGQLTAAPTSTSWSVTGTSPDANESTKTYVTYLFATLAGISKVGSYTGNGSTGQAIACGFSAGARFVLIKRTDSTGDWYTFDSARGLTSGSSPYLLLNSTAAETTGNNGVYASTGGFTLATSAAGLNASGGTYIFLAVA